MIDKKPSNIQLVAMSVLGPFTMHLIIPAITPIQFEFGIDAGMAALLIEKGSLSVIHRGETIALPSSDDNLKAYFQKIELLEPDPGYVQKMIQLVDLPADPIPATTEEKPAEVETANPQ